MPSKNKTYPLNQSPLFKLTSRKRFAAIVGLTTTELQKILIASDGLYSEFEIQKKSGGARGVENPHRNLKLIQARLARLLMRIAPPEYLFCPVKGRCYVTNAAQHRGQRVIRCLDIRKYFPSTPSRRVYWFFHKVMRCENDIAAIIAKLACYKGHLPTGSPLSPIMAYFAYYDVWETVSALCKAHGYRLTVYIDDVTISGKTLSSDIIWEIKRAIHRSGLRYHKEKRFVDRPAEITGVIVDGVRLVPPNRQLKKIHEAQKVTQRDAPGSDQERLNILAGLRGQVQQIRKVQEGCGPANSTGMVALLCKDVALAEEQLTNRSPRSGPAAGTG